MKTASLRTRVAQVVWLLCVAAALFLAIGALLVAVDATNEGNDLVRFVIDVADAVDLGVFSRKNGVMDFGGANADTKDALFNWGLAAIVWLILGRIADRLIRP